MPAREYILTPKQKTAWGLLEDPRYRRYLFDGGARSGKTDLTLAWLVAQATAFPGARILVARLHLDHARTTLWNLSLKKLLPPCGMVQYQEQTLECRFANGSVIRVGGLDDAERVDKILGDEYLHVFINEATQVTWDTVTKVMTRLSQQVPGAVRKLILDCNPKGPRHWLHQVGVEHVLPNDGSGEAQPLPDAGVWARLSWTPYDNPHLPPDTIRTLEALPGVMRRRMLLGEWCTSEGMVYDGFDPDIHCFDALPEGSEGWPRLRSIDFGFTNPFCCLWGALDGDGRLWIYRELYERGQRADQLAPRILGAEEGSFTTVADPEDAEARATLAAAGLDTTPADKQVVPGIQAVQKRLAVAGDGRPRLYVSRRCVNVINEMYEYRWADQRQGREQDERPVKEHDHAMDAMRYMVMEADRPRVYAAEPLRKPPETRDAPARSLFGDDSDGDAGEGDRASDFARM